MTIRGPFFYLDQFKKYLRKIIDETPRSCAILGIAYLDTLLNELLKVRLIENKDLFKRYIDRLNTDRRIALCYLVGIIDKNTKEDLDILNEIRNKFAHKIDLDSFDEVIDNFDIPAELNKLNIMKEQEEFGAPIATPREKYFIAVSGYMFLLEHCLENCPRISMPEVAVRMLSHFKSQS